MSLFWWLTTEWEYKLRIRRAAFSYLESNRVLALVILWNVVILIQLVAPSLILCFGIYIIYIHDRRAHYFLALLPWKYSLIIQSTNSITEKSPTWLLASTQTWLSNMMPSWVFDCARLQNQINEVYTYVQGKIMNHRKITADFSNSIWPRSPLLIWVYIYAHLVPLMMAFHRGSIIQGKPFRWHHGSPGGWFVSVNPSVIFFVMIAQLLIQGPSCWNSVPWFATEKIKSDIQTISMKSVRAFENRVLQRSPGLDSRRMQVCVVPELSVSFVLVAVCIYHHP